MSRDPINLLIHGEPKSGKTTFAVRRNPKALVIDTEKSSRLMRGLNRYELQAFKDVDSILQKIEKEKLESVIIDTLDVLVGSHLKKETKDLGGDYVRQHNMLGLQGWGYMRDRFEDVCRKFQEVGANVCLLCHSELVQKPDGSKKWTMQLPSDYARQVMGMMDMIGFMEKLPNPKSTSDKDKFIYRLNLEKTHLYDAGTRDVYDVTDDSFHSILPSFMDNPALVDILKAYDDFFAGEPLPCHKCRKEGKILPSAQEADNGKRYCDSCFKEYENYKASKIKEDNQE